MLYYNWLIESKLTGPESRTRQAMLKNKNNKKKHNMLYKGVATCYLNLLFISSCCFDTNSEFTEIFPMIHLYQIAHLITNGQ